MHPERDRRGAAVAARMGPNAIIQVGAALARLEGAVPARALFAGAGIAAHFDHAPTRMVDEGEVGALHRALRTRLGLDKAREVARDAGLATGDYLLANRIPQAAQLVLRALPAGLASRGLLAAIGRHAWTFAGSGSFAVRAGTPLRIAITGCPLCRGETLHTVALCDYYAATFERLFRALVHRRTTVTEVECEARGGSACLFELRWR